MRGAPKTALSSNVSCRFVRGGGPRINGVQCPVGCSSRCEGINGSLLDDLRGNRAGDLALQRLTGRGGLLRASDELRLTRTTTSPPFIMAINAPRWRGGAWYSAVSRFVEEIGVHEPGYTAHWRALVQRCCSGHGHVLDVGANLGFFSLFSAALGCHVHAWEPIEPFADHIALSASLNGPAVARRITLHRAAMTDGTQSDVTLQAPVYGWDISSVDGLNLGPGLRVINVSATAHSLDAHAPRTRACAMKIDVEGSEPAVIRGAARLLRSAPPKFMLFEYTPGARERQAAAGEAGALDRYAEFAEMLGSLQSAGYRLFKLDSVHKTAAYTAGESWRPLLPEIGAEAVAAEAENAEGMRRAYTGGGFHMPADIDPRSFRASFRYNTDVLAVLRSADPGVAKLVRSAGPVRPMRMRAQARAARLPVPRMDNNSSRARNRRGPAVPLNHPNCWWRAGGCFLKEGHGVEIPRNG